MRVEGLRDRFGDPGGADAPATDSPAPESAPPEAEADDASKRDVLERLRRQIASLDKRWGRTHAEEPEPPSGEYDGRSLPGRLVDTPRGPVRVVSDVVPRSARHGRAQVACFGDDPACLAALGRLYRLPGVPDPARLVFLDTETTGLAGGAGTLPFLVGLAWLEGGDLRIEQVFLDHPRQEGGMVALLADRLSRFDHVVTYNGRAFDVPLVQNRFVLHRTPWPSLGTALDLLSGARRLHRHHLDDRSLGSIERNVLGFEREGDVHGSRIPGIYHRFLLSGRPEGLAEVIRHNAWDVIAMAALLGFQAGLLAAGPGATDQPAVDLALGEIAWEAHEYERAAAYLSSAVERLGGDRRAAEAARACARAHHVLALVNRRLGRHPEAAASWTAILRADPRDGVAHLGLAKYHEHRTRDLAAAERHARAAASAGAEGGEEAVRRVERILGKADPDARDGRPPA